MTVSTTDNYVSYAGNDFTKIFSYDFKIFAASDLRVYIIKSTGETILKTLITDYAVSGVGNPGGGNVNMVVAPATGETLLIKRVVPLTQETAYSDGDSFPAEAHEYALDRAVMITQQLQRQLDRALQLRDSVTGVSNELPVPSPGKALGWNATGTNVVNLATVGAVGFSSLGELFVGLVTAEEMRTLIGAGGVGGAGRAWAMMMGI